MSTYPPISDGQIISVGLLRAITGTEVVKAANTDRASTTTLVDDPELVAYLEPNAVYKVAFSLMVAGRNSVAGDLGGNFKTEWSTPPGSTGLKSVFGPGSAQPNTANADGVAPRIGVHVFDTDMTYALVRNSTASLLVVREWCDELTTTAAGMLSLAWAQGDAHATATRIAAGSSLSYRRIG
ncbi:hypothetical protein [Actinomadura nitritigenes]|uniref:hypothetical protein n=1 Tax=Actinomadura nitritigenes TaxID=134602 RepID=UPI003D93A151